MVLILKILPQELDMGESVCLAIAQTPVKIVYILPLLMDQEASFYFFDARRRVFEWYPDAQGRHPWKCKGIMKTVKKDKTMRLYHRRWWKIWK